MVEGSVDGAELWYPMIYLQKSKGKESNTRQECSGYEFEVKMGATKMGKNIYVVCK